MKNLLPDWEEFEGGPRNRPSEPRIRISAKGTMTFTRAAVEQYGISENAELLFDRKSKRKIGLRLQPNETDKSRRVTRHKDSGSASMNIEKFIKTYLTDMQFPAEPQIEKSGNTLVLTL